MNSFITTPVIAFALLRQCSEAMRSDLLSGVAILIKPLVADLAGQLFDSRVLSERLAKAYGISIPASALEGMTDRLTVANLLRLEKTDSGLNRVLYATVDTSSLLAENSEQDFQELLDDFLEFSKVRLKANGREISDDRLQNEFLRHLATLDFSSIRAKPVLIGENRATTISGPTAREQATLSVELAERAALDALVASFISSLVVNQPDRLTLLAKVADGALAAELVFDLRAPTSVQKLTNTTVVLDTPLILSFLDLSSTADFADAKKMIEQILETGAKVGAFKHSIAEAEYVLKATQFSRETSVVHGPLVYRLANSAFRAYFESMIGSVGRIWGQDHNFEIVPETATHYHKNFTPLDEEDLFRAIRQNILDRVETTEKDAKSVAETMRRLGGAHVPATGINNCRYIFATSNLSLQRRVSFFLKQRKFVLDGEFTPVVTSRYLSGLCWLLCGGKTDQSPTTARLLANCSAALRIKPEIAERTKRFLAEVSEEKAIHFEALMTNQRASQYLAEVTLGDINAITANNASDIYEEVQRRAAEKVAMEKDAHYQGTIIELNSKIKETEDSLDVMRKTLLATQFEADIRTQEAEGHAARSTAVERKNIENQSRILKNEIALREFEAKSSEATASEQRAKSALKKQWAVSRADALRFAQRRTSNIRWAGVVALFALTFLVGYLDKFVIPMLAPENQNAGNIFIIGLQTVLSLSGLASLFDPIVKGPMERLRKSLYIDRLKDLGTPESDEIAGDA
jgi:hypothetical protein